MLNEFVRDVMINYVEDDNPEVRKAAALSSCQLFIKDPIVYQTSNHAIQVVSQVLEKLLTVGITDPGRLPKYRTLMVRSQYPSPRFVCLRREVRPTLGTVSQYSNSVHRTE